MNDPKHDPEAFKAELRALLTKYGVTINANVDGDTHGIWGETISIEGHWRDPDRINIEIDGWEIAPEDLA